MSTFTDVIARKSFKRGYEEGLKLAREKQGKEIALRMHKMNIPVEQIADIQGVDITLVEKWIAEEAE